jgi:hypothetical protein
MSPDLGFLEMIFHSFLSLLASHSTFTAVSRYPHILPTVNSPVVDPQSHRVGKVAVLGVYSGC